MATDVTVAPSDGNAVLFMNGTGGVPSYGAIDLRRMIRAASAFQEGVFGSGDWKVTEKAGGTNMSVDVAANVDVAVVKNDALLTPQDLYVVAPHSAAANLGTIGGNSSGNPRLDYVVLQVRNQDHDGSGQYDARVRYLTGTPNASASHSNPAGAPTIPDSAVLLAQVLVPTGTTSAITNSMIRDRRPWACGYRYLAHLADQTMAAQAIGITSAFGAQRVEVSAGADLEVWLTSPGIVWPATQTDLRIAVYVDGSLKNYLGKHRMNNVADNQPGGGRRTLINTTDISTGSHLIQWGHMANHISGTMTLEVPEVGIREVPSVSATNGSS